MKIFLILLEAAIIIFLLVRLVLNKSKMNSFVKQAEMIKKRHLNMEDLEIDEDDRRGTEAVLADAINAIKNNMQAFLESTKGNVVVLSDAIETLSDGAHANQEGSQRIAESLASVVDKVDEQLQVVKTCLDLIEENSARLSEIDGSVKGIGGLLGETVTSCRNGLQGMENYESNMTTVAEDLTKSEKILEEFSDKISEINEISSFIISISSSLKMLALNASIEAARVGNAGSGFAVVAKEMEVMSEKTQEGIGTINEILENVVESSQQVTDCIRESADVYSKSRKEFDAVSGSFRTINAQSNDINEKMKEINSKIDRISDNFKATREQAEQAYATSEEITAGTQEISSISQEASISSQKIIDNVESLDDMLNGLKGLLRQFTTSVEPVSAKPQKQVKIAVFCIVDNDFWRSVRRGSIYAQKELETLGAKVTYVPFYAWGTVYEEINELMDKMLLEDYDGYALPGFMLDNVAEKMKRAIELGKKVYSFNCAPKSMEYCTAVFQPDVADGAIAAAKVMDRSLKRKGRVVVLEGGRDVSVNAIRSDSFQEYLKKSGGSKVTEVLHVDYDRDVIYKQVTEYLKAHDDVDGMFLTTGRPVEVARAIEDSKKKVKLVVFDHSDEIFQYIKKGIIVGAIGQDPFGQGYDPIVWMYNCTVTGRELPSTNMKCRSTVVDRNNVDSLVET